MRGIVHIINAVYRTSTHSRVTQSYRCALGGVWQDHSLGRAQQRYHYINGEPVGENSRISIQSNDLEHVKWHFTIS